MPLPAAIQTITAHRHVPRPCGQPVFRDRDLRPGNAVLTVVRGHRDTICAGPGLKADSSLGPVSFPVAFAPRLPGRRELGRPGTGWR